MPIVILSEHKEAYLNAFEGADRGEYQWFVDFMLERSLDTIQLVGESMLGALSPTPDEGAAAINGLYVTKGGYSQDQVDNAGKLLLRSIQDEFKKAIARNVGVNLKGNSTPIMGLHSGPDSAHRLPVDGERGLNVEFESRVPAQAKVYRQFVIWLPTDADCDDDIQFILYLSGNDKLAHPSGRELVLSARMDELIPSVSGILQIRIGMFAERVVGEMLAELKPLAEKALRGER